MQNNALKNDLIAFGITPKQCIDKIFEHARDCSYIAISMAENDLVDKYGNKVEQILARIIRDRLEANRKVLRQQIHKWKLYRKLLLGAEQRERQITSFDIQRAKEFDLVAIVDKVITVRKTSNNYVALCPFHKEDTPSFTIRNNRWRCFGCGESGDTIAFIMKTTDSTFKDAVLYLSR